MTTLQSFKNSPRAATSQKICEIEMTALREDSASVHAGGAFSQISLQDRYDTSAHGSAAAAAPQPAAARALHPSVKTGAVAGRLPTATLLRKRRKALWADKKTLSEQIAELQKLDVKGSRLWDERDLQTAVFTHQLVWGVVCLCTVVGFLGAAAFFKGAHDARMNKNLVLRVLEAGGPQAELASLQAKLDQTIQELEAVTDQLDAT